MITALIPAHNEASNITTTIAALRDQTAKVDRIVVIADNCTDDTVALSLAAGAEVYETVGNSARKAGAALTRLSGGSGLGAVGAVFEGGSRGALEACQANERTRYAIFLQYVFVESPDRKYRWPARHALAPSRT